MWCGVFVILISISLGNSLWSWENPRVKTEFGIHQGIWSETVRGQRVASFLGIPYAKPPIGDLRFKKPAPWTRLWRKVRDASEYRPNCLTLEDADEGSEDCLYLNIFTQQVIQNSKRDKNETKRAVIVFLISDTFVENNNSLYTPDYLLDQNVILVTLNYRLGYFGFFTTGDMAAPGNYGLKDVLEGLRWVQRNIAAFGGDPGSVTLMGHGAGAGVVHLLALSKKSDGLFHRYVTQSGGAQMLWSYRSRNQAKTISLEFADSVNCTRDTHEKIVECLQDMPASINGYNDTEIISLWNNYGPTNEPPSDEAVITEHPKTLIQRGKARDIPWLTGVVADEGLLAKFIFDNNSTLCKELDSRFEEILYTIANYRDAVTDNAAYLEALSSYYFDYNITEDCMSDLAEFTGDALINWPIYDGMTSQARKMKSNVYFYNFAYNGTFTTTFHLDDSERFGVSHGDEINYLFPVLNNLFEDLQLKNTEYDIAMINIITEMWANFAKTGIPRANLSPAWKSYQDGQGYMEFGPGAELSMKEHFLQDRMSFWLNVTKDLFTPVKKQNGKTSNARGSAWRVTENYHISKNILAFFVPLAILAIFTR